MPLHVTFQELQIPKGKEITGPEEANFHRKTTVLSRGLRTCFMQNYEIERTEEIHTVITEC